MNSKFNIFQSFENLAYLFAKLAVAASLKIKKKCQGKKTKFLIVTFTSLVKI